MVKSINILLSRTFLVILFLVILVSSSFGWFDQSFKFSQGLNVSENSGKDLFDYQILINLSYTLNMSNDFSDIKFTYLNQSNGVESEVDFYIDKLVKSQFALIYIKVPFIPANNFSQINIYYGKTGVVSNSNLEKTFSYNVPRKVGYVVSDRLVLGGIDIISLGQSENLITNGVSNLSLNSSDTGFFPSSELNINTAVYSKTLFGSDGKLAGSEMITPISFAGTHFYSYFTRFVDKFNFVSPFGIANVSIFDNGNLIWNGSVNESGREVIADIINGHNSQIISNIPILASHIGNSVGDSMVLYPATTESLFGNPSTSYTLGTGSFGANINFVSSSGILGSYNINSNLGVGFGGTGLFGGSEVYKFSSNNLFGGGAYGDGSGGESTSFLPEKEMGILFGSSNSVIYIAIAAPSPNTNCTVYDSLGNLIQNKIGGVRNDINFIGFGTGNSSVFISGGWKLTCSKPVFMVYDNSVNSGETNSWSWKQMRQYIYPEPSFTLGNPLKYDSIPPVINYINFSDFTTLKNSPIQIFVNSTDNKNISYLSGKIINPLGNSFNFNFSKNSNNIFYYSFLNTTQLGNYSLNVTSFDFGENNVSLSSQFDVIEKPWYDSKFRYRIPIRIEEKNGSSRVNFPLEVRFNFSTHKAHNQSLVIIDENLNRIPLQIVSSNQSNGKYSSAKIVFPINILANNVSNYFLYYGDINLNLTNISNFFSNSTNGFVETYNTDKLSIDLNIKSVSSLAGIVGWRESLNNNQGFGPDLISTQDTGVFGNGVISFGDAKDTLGKKPILIEKGDVFNKFSWEKSDGLVNLTFFRGTDYIKVDFQPKSFANYFVLGDENTVLYTALNYNFPDKVDFLNSSFNFFSSSLWGISFIKSTFIEPWYFISNQTSGFVFTFNNLASIKDILGVSYSNLVESTNLEYKTLSNNYSFYISFIGGNKTNAREKYLEMKTPLNIVVSSEEIPIDNQSPKIISTMINPQIIENGSTTVIRSNIIDNFEVTSAFSIIEFPNGTKINKSMINIGNDIFETNFTANLIGSYNIYIISEDGRGNKVDSGLSQKSLAVVQKNNSSLGDWFNYSWPNRLSISVLGSNFTKINDLVSFNINFSQFLKDNGISNKTVDINSLRVVEKGDLNLTTIPIKFDKNFSKLSFVLNGTTLKNVARDYFLYFDFNGSNKSMYDNLIWQEDEFFASAGVTGRVEYVESFKNGSFANSTVIEDIGANSWGVGVGDFDNDGKFDIISGDSLGEIKFLRHLNGTGNFSNSTVVGNITPSSYVFPITTGDYNNDGNLDFIVSPYKYNEFDVFLGLGNGSFNKTKIIPLINYGVLYSKVSGDFNNDSCEDFVVGRGYSILYLGNCDGTFNQTTDTSLISKLSYYGLANGDFNNDGNLDLVLAPNSVSNWNFVSGIGNGSFNPLIQTKISQDYGWTFGDGFDFDHDGNLDMIVADYSSKGLFYFYKGYGNGSFENKIVGGNFLNLNNMDLGVPYIKRNSRVSLGSLENLPLVNLSYNISPQNLTDLDLISVKIVGNFSRGLNSCKISFNNGSFAPMTLLNGQIGDLNGSFFYESNFIGGDFSALAFCLDTTGFTKKLVFNFSVSSNNSNFVSNIPNLITVSTSGGSSSGGGGSGWSSSFIKNTINNTQESKLVAKISDNKKNYIENLNSSISTLNSSIKKIDFIKPNTPTNVNFEGTTITSLNLITNKLSNNVTFSIKDISEKPVETSPIGNIYKFLKITPSNLDDSQINSVNISFKIEKNWSLNLNLTKNDIYLQRFHNDNWNILKTNFVYEDEKFLYFTAKSPGFSFYSIVGDKNQSYVLSKNITNVSSENVFLAGKNTLNDNFIRINTFYIFVGIGLFLILSLFVSDVFRDKFVFSKKNCVKKKKLKKKHLNNNMDIYLKRRFK